MEGKEEGGETEGGGDRERNHGSQRDLSHTVHHPPQLLDTV